ncbi:MAG: ATP-binding protein [Thermoanaerobaculia bacterium]|nr:ATP-binding protein [Thermoanaerobaculia bacterium]
MRLYYLPLHWFSLWHRLQAKAYGYHPVSWDSVCLLPFPGLDQLLVARAELEPTNGDREIDRLIDEYPSQRQAALRARAILIARRSATADLARLDEALAGLPEGEKGFLKDTSELRLRVHAITAAKTRLDTLDRPFLREPYAALLVTEIEKFEQQIAGFKPPLSTEFRKAARRWLEVACRELDAARKANAREPTRQVFRAGDPVDRDNEAFVPRNGPLGELERQVLLATGCPGLVVYGRRRMGKSTLLRNLAGFLPPRVQIASLSMQQASAFTSLPDFLNLLGQNIAEALIDVPNPPANLKDLEHFLDATQQRLEADDRRLLVAIDEYENIDRKIGEGVFPEDLLAAIRESIQTHRRIIWTFAGSHEIDELHNAPWTSYLVSARTVEALPFEAAETRLLLTEPLKYSTLWRNLETQRPRFEPGFWGEGGIDRIHTETAGWPHLVQLVAETIVDLLNDAGQANVDHVLFERALDRAVVRGNNVFLELLEKESRLPGEHAYLRAFRTREEQPPPPDEAIGRSLRRRLMLIEEGDRCRLRVPLMGRWLRQRG